MKTVYWFKPNGHWNVLEGKEIFDFLSRFFGPEYLRVTEEK